MSSSNPRTPILIVEDEASIRAMLRFALERAGYACVEAATAAEARLRLAESTPALALVDWMLPDRSGLDLVREWKEDECHAALPVILVTARGEEADKLRGFECGADDYVTKPFSPRELLARIRAVLRRGQAQAPPPVLELDGLRLDTAAHRVSAGGQRLEMGPTEFRLLHFFLTHQDRVYSRAQLLDHVWGRNVYVEERTVDVHIRRLRKALAPSGHDRLVQTVRGAGYRFSSDG